MSSSAIPSTCQKVRTAASLILLGLLTLFAMQNLGPIEVHFLDWSFASRRIIVIAGSFTIGLAVGLLMSGRRRA
jgi:uncharacterized integral membrane protein